MMHGLESLIDNRYEEGLALHFVLLMVLNNQPLISDIRLLCLLKITSLVSFLD